MTFKFTSQEILSGYFEPEGIYLSAPFDGEFSITQGWGDNAEFYAQWRYAGVPLKGHNGVDVHLPAESPVFAMDEGRVTEIGVERGGLERYLKLEHRWGESLYANLGEVGVESGQEVARGQQIALTPALPTGDHFFHFAVRIAPYNRYDGWGGYSDPLPYMAAGFLLPQDDGSASNGPATAVAAVTGEPSRDAPHAMIDDRPGVRRP